MLPNDTPAKTLLALTLWQPWASLVAHGLKQYETRHWQPPKSLIGRIIAIHAAKRWTVEEARYMKHFVLTYPAVKEVLYQDHLLRPPLGAIVAAVRLVDCFPVEAVRDAISPMEREFGNYAAGRFAWQLELIKRPDTPVPAAGQQGFWMWKAQL